MNAFQSFIRKKQKTLNIKSLLWYDSFCQHLFEWPIPCFLKLHHLFLPYYTFISHVCLECLQILQLQTPTVWKSSSLHFWELTYFSKFIFMFFSTCIHCICLCFSYCMHLIFLHYLQISLPNLTSTCKGYVSFDWCLYCPAQFSHIAGMHYL